MGQATRIAEDILGQPITTMEAAARREEERTLQLPEATPDGEIIERPAPTAAPRSAYQAAPATWD
jgi:hypothetical protein